MQAKKEFPHVPAGSFTRAVEAAVPNAADIAGISVVIAHQTFLANNDQAADHWPLEHPLLVSGHLHHPHSPQPNIFYPGSSLPTDADAVTLERHASVALGVFNTNGTGLASIVNIPLTAVPIRRNLRISFDELQQQKENAPMIRQIDRMLQSRANNSSTKDEFLITVECPTASAINVVHTSRFVEKLCSQHPSVRIVAQLQNKPSSTSSVASRRRGGTHFLKRRFIETAIFSVFAKNKIKCCRPCTPLLLSEFKKREAAVPCIAQCTKRFCIDSDTSVSVHAVFGVYFDRFLKKHTSSAKELVTIDKIHEECTKRLAAKN